MQSIDLYFILPPIVQNVQVSDTTGDAIKYKSRGKIKNPAGYHLRDFQ